MTWTQSPLNVAGPLAAGIAELSWAMFIGAAVIFLLVTAFTVVAIFGGARRGFMTGTPFVVGFGFVFPVAVLSVLLVYGLALTRNTLAQYSPFLRMEVIGERWWWRVHYLDAAGAVALATANEIRIPTDRPVELTLKTQEVIHSFWAPSLGGKLDMIPGRANRYRFAAERAGIYRGQCAEYCGAQHALMAFYVVAMDLADFQAWHAQQTATAAEPTTPLAARGRDLFVAAGCGACHSVRGTPAVGQIGPDLTHIGGRLSIAAGSYPLNAAMLAGWIASAQHLKPGNLMPSFANLRGEELRALAAYLEGLK